MRPSAWLLITQVCICVALAGSAVLYVHYLNPADSDFCGAHSGCEVVRRSGISYFFGSRFISLPLFAMAAFMASLALTLLVWRAPPAPSTGLAALDRQPELAVFAASGLGATLAVGLLAYQVVGLDAFCWLCTLVDVAAIAAAASAFMLARAARHGQRADAVLSRPAWAGIALVLAGAPLTWNAIKPAPPIPATIAALYQPGKINVVEFADFECPYCRRLHALLDPLVEAHGQDVHFVRIHRPLPQHANAEHAARAALCADQQGRGKEMADGLFAEPLSEQKIGALAERLRLDPGAFDACMGSEATRRTLAEHAALLPDEELRGLPTLYVGSQRFIGVPTEAALRDALARAGHAEPFSLPGPLYLGGVLVALGMLVYFGRRQSRAVR